MLEPAVEARPWDEQRALDDCAYREQLAYLLERSPFYRAKLAACGIGVPADAGGLEGIAAVPVTTKDELRAARNPGDPFGPQLCVDRSEIARVYSTSGTTGTPTYIPLTAGDVENWVAGSARSYSASGIGAGDMVVTTYAAGPFVAGAALDAFARTGAAHVPVGSGNTARLLLAIEELRPTAIVLTPSYASHLLEQAELSGSSVRRVLVAGEPGGGEPAFRARLEEGWGACVTEAMGIGDIGPSLWGECGEQDGMHLGARGLVHAELIDPDTASAVALEDAAEGELVLTHLRHRAAPLLRFRTRDHVVVRVAACPCGRTSPGIRCIGRTDDMLIVRGVNVFPSAVREVVAGFAPAVSGNIVVRPRTAGVKQEPPLPVTVELAPQERRSDVLAESIRQRLRAVLVVQADVDLVPFGALQRSEYKSTLIER
jgi:phenylacetate-CoA ligase